MTDNPSEHLYIPQASVPLEFTGERLTSAVKSDITFEHWHRYALAERLCRGKDVLDLASGEGYGSALISTNARSVVGMDVDQASIDHAKASYVRENLSYIQASATLIPALDSSFDIVVSMETLEHISSHDLFLKEIKRVLRKDGLLIISSPNAAVYSGPFQPINPHHTSELMFNELEALLRTYFNNIQFMGQVSINGNAILHLNNQSKSSNLYNQNYGNRLEFFDNTCRSMYYIGIAADDCLPDIPMSLFNAAHYHAEQSVSFDNLKSKESVLLRNINQLESELRLKEEKINLIEEDLMRTTGMLEATRIESEQLKELIGVSKSKFELETILLKKIEQGIDNIIKNKLSD